MGISTLNLDLPERAGKNVRWIVKHLGEIAAHNLIVMNNDDSLLEALRVLARKFVERGAQSGPLFSDLNEV
jgi:hypothetical protein